MDIEQEFEKFEEEDEAYGGTKKWKKGQNKMKKAGVKLHRKDKFSGYVEEVELDEALKPIDKSVVDAFYYKKEKAGKVVSTDGNSLWKNGLGGQEIAIWMGRKIHI